MSKNCQKLIVVIEELITDIEARRKIWDMFIKHNPNLESFLEEKWLKEEALCWMHGTADICEINEQEKWLFVEPPISKTVISKARTEYNAWGAYINEEGGYHEFKKEDLSAPIEEESLNAYIITDVTR